MPRLRPGDWWLLLGLMKSLRLALLAGLVSLSANALEVPNFAAANLVLGQPDFTTGTLANLPMAGNLEEPSAVVVDPATGKVFVADTGNHRVLRYASAAALRNGDAAELVFGDSTLTNGAFEPAALDTMQGPCGLCIDAGGRLWVSDTDNHRVLMFANAAAISTNGPNASLVLGQPDGTSDTSGTTKSLMNGPMGLAVDAGGRLWVADYGNNRVLRFDDAANSATGAASADADGVQGQGQDPVLKFTSSTARHDQNGFAEPVSVTVDAGGTLWVADRANNRVLGFPSAATVSDGTNAARIVGQPDFTTVTPGTSAIKFSWPSGVFADAKGGLWVLDQGNNRALYYGGVQSLNINEPASLVVGQANFTSSAASLGPRNVDSPFLGIFAEPAGDLWISDLNHHRVLRFGAVDNLAPTITLRGKSKVTTPRKRLVVRGTASDDVAVTRVTLQIGRRKIAAAGTTSWKKPIRLAAKRTVVKAWASDDTGNTSSTVRLVILQKTRK